VLYDTYFLHSYGRKTIVDVKFKKYIYKWIKPKYIIYVILCCIVVTLPKSKTCKSMFYSGTLLGRSLRLSHSFIVVATCSLCLFSRYLVVQYTRYIIIYSSALWFSYTFSTLQTPIFRVLWIEQNTVTCKVRRHNMCT